MDDKPPFNSLEGICKWAADLGYKGIQIPAWESCLIDLTQAGQKQDYCEELKEKSTASVSKSPSFPPISRDSW